MKSDSNVCMNCNSCTRGNCGSSMGWTNNCGSHCGHGNGHYALRWILGIIILGAMFSLGAMFGMLSAQIREQNRDYYMMRGPGLISNGFLTNSNISELDETMMMEEPYFEEIVE